MKTHQHSKNILATLSFTLCISTANTANAQIDDAITHYGNLKVRVEKSDDTVLELFHFVDGFAWTTDNKKKISNMLLDRIDTLDARLQGTEVSFPPVTKAAEQGPPERIYSDERIPDQKPPKRMKKKVCKAGGWDASGYALGAYGVALDEQLKRAIKKCLKHKVTLDVEAYTQAYNRGLKDYCSYERGLFVTARESSNSKICYDKGFTSFDTGVRHGQQKLPYYTIRNDVYSDNYLIRGMKSSLARARRGIPTGTTEPYLYTRHESILDQDYERSQRDVQAIKDFKAEHPHVFTAPESWKHIRADKDLDYPIPY